VLDRRTFERTKVEIGWCDVCGTGKAVYRSREAQAKVWEGCYAKLVREGNRGGGEVRVAHTDPSLSGDMKTLKEFGKKYARI